jgi:hypothetical protein
MKPETQLKIFLALERLWGFGALICVGCTIYFLAIRDNDSALFFFAFFVLSALFYILRKRQRRKFEKAFREYSDSGRDTR